MLTKVTIENFKRFGRVDVDLGDPVVFIGPNNSGKTTALQAIALWVVGLRRWNEKRKGKKTPEKRPGVTINRNDLLAIPIPNANLLWRDLHVRDVQRIDGKQTTKNICIHIIVQGVTLDKEWICGLELDYANEESFYCRPLRLSAERNSRRMEIPEAAGQVQVAFLPPMSGLAANETRLDTGAINVRVGEGRTAEVLRNLCYKIYKEKSEFWEKLASQIRSLFGSELEAPEYIQERGEIRMRYKEKGILLDLSCSGRGLQQTLLLLSYLYANPGSVLLLDEPDAHLEILRQRQIYQLLVDVARENDNQIIAASHSEVLLNEAAEKDVVIAFVGSPHRIDDRGSQVLKSLRDIGFEHYYQAEQTGWVLYLEGSTDLAILLALASRLHLDEAVEVLQRPFVHYVANQPNEALKHFHGLREGCPNLIGVAIFDRLDQNLPATPGINITAWRHREIESYLCTEKTLLAFAQGQTLEGSIGPLFDETAKTRRVNGMQQAIEEVTKALEVLGKGSPWDGNMKVSDEFLGPVFEKYFAKLQLPNMMNKKNFHELARYVPVEEIDREVREKLETIVSTSKKAQAATE